MRRSASSALKQVSDLKRKAISPAGLANTKRVSLSREGALAVVAGNATEAVSEREKGLVGGRVTTAGGTLVSRPLRRSGILATEPTKDVLRGEVEGTDTT